MFMNAMKLAVYNLKKTWKSTIFYAMSLFITSFVSYFFVAATVLDKNHCIEVALQMGLSDAHIDFFYPAITSIAVSFSVFLVFFANSFFLKNNAQELVVLTISGGEIKTKTSYLLTQNMCIYLITIPFGMFFGSLLLYLIGPMMAPHFDVGYFSILTLEHCFYTFCILLLVILFLVMLNCGFAYRLSLLELLNVSRDLKMESKASHKLAILSIPLYIFSIYMLLTTKTRFVYHPFTHELLGIDTSMLYFFGLLATISILSIMLRAIPNFLTNRQKKKSLKHRRFMVAAGNLIVDLKSSAALILMIMSSSLIFTCLIGIFHDDSARLAFLLVSNALLMLINIFGVVYVMLISFQRKKYSFYQLQTLGYLNSDLKSIIRMEICAYFGLIMFFPTSIMACFLYKFIEIELLSFNFAATFLGIFVIANIMGAIMVIFAYNHIMKKEKENI